jgi:hypothetical protein
VCLRTMVSTIHKLPVRSFTFLQCLPGTELLNLSGTPYPTSPEEFNQTTMEDASSADIYVHLLAWKSARPHGNPRETIQTLTSLSPDNMHFC